MSTEWLTTPEQGNLPGPAPGGAVSTPGPVVLEPLEAGHVGACVALWGAEGMIHEENAGGRVVELLGLCPGLSRVALRDGVVVGCALASYDGFAGQLFRVVVDESLRGRGIGSSLVQECVERLRARGARRIVLGCEERLVPWYARLGFGASPARFLVRGL